MACRDMEKANVAVADIKTSVGTEGTDNLGELVLEKLDLTSLASVRECAKKILASESHIDILINNAGMT